MVDFDVVVKEILDRVRVVDIVLVANCNVLILKDTFIDFSPPYLGVWENRTIENENKISISIGLSRLYRKRDSETYLSFLRKRLNSESTGKLF